MRRYAYVGPDEIRRAVLARATLGTEIRTTTDLEPFATAEPLTFVVGVDGILRVADRRSEHVACAGGEEVLSAGELTAVRSGPSCSITDISNQSTGYCPEPGSWQAVANALDLAGIAHPGHFTFEVVFRRCTHCGERNLVKESWFYCEICGAVLSHTWNF